MMKIVINPKVRHGKPVIRGTRITVEEVLGALAGGMQYDEIKAEYGLTENEIRVAIAYAFAFLKGEEVRPLVKA